jgi:hypothetical protein
MSHPPTKSMTRCRSSFASTASSTRNTTTVSHLPPLHLSSAFVFCSCPPCAPTHSLLSRTFGDVFALCSLLQQHSMTIKSHRGLEACFEFGCNCLALRFPWLLEHSRKTALSTVLGSGTLRRTLWNLFLSSSRALLFTMCIFTFSQSSAPCLFRIAPSTAVRSFAQAEVQSCTRSGEVQPRVDFPLLAGFSSQTYTKFSSAHHLFSSQASRAACA